MTIFRLYAQNGHCAGFWVQHRQWTNTCARVHSVSGHQSGVLPRHAERHREADIVMELFDVRSGRPVQAAPVSARDGQFHQIAEPAWCRPRFPVARAPAALSAS